MYNRYKLYSFTNIPKLMAGLHTLSLCLNLIKEAVDKDLVKMSTT